MHVSDPGELPVVGACLPAVGIPNQRLTVEVSGSNFDFGATVSFDGRITVQGVTWVSITKLDVRIKIHKQARLELRQVTVTNLDGQSHTVGCFTVVASL